MTLSSGRTATKRHTWLVGATTVAMAVALIGVGPIAANAIPMTGVFALQVTPQSDTTPLTFTSTTAATGAGSTAITFASPKVTTTTTVGTTTATKDVTGSFKFGFDSSSGEATSGAIIVMAVDDATSSIPAPNGQYTLTLTPSSFSAATVSGAVTQNFTVIDGNIYVGGTQTAAGTPIKAMAPLVKATYGTVTELGGGSAALYENGTLVAGETPETSDSLYVPAGATYRVVATGVAPALTFTSDVPFVGTGLSALPNISGSASLSVSASQAAPVAFGNAVATVWKAPTVSPFNDVRTSTQFYNEMSWLSATGVSTGYADGGYHPAATIKRNAMAAFLYRLAGSPKVDPATVTAANKTFSDLSTSTQFDTEIAWLWQQGITTGYDGGTFRPAAEVTRGAMAAFLYRFANNDTSDEVAGTPVTATDAPAANYANGTFGDVYGSTQFAGDIAWLASAGQGFPTSGDPVGPNDEKASAGVAITGGYADGSFRPNANIRRNAMAAFLYRLVYAPRG